MEKVGEEGVITVKEGRIIEDEIEITQGMRFDHGYISPYFVTSAKAQRVELEKPFILLSEKKTSLLQDILPSHETATQARRPLVIITEDVDERLSPPLSSTSSTANSKSSLSKPLALATTTNPSSVISPSSPVKRYR